jgi:succinylarginine dihydrolase
MMNVYEVNLDGLVGPTHHYAGLSTGNMASINNALRIANPAAAALQGIAKMRLLHHLGIKQAFIPPHPRPNLSLLRQLGFSGSAEIMLKKAKQIAPAFLSACYSASSMWTANAATVSPSTDTADQRVHFTPANLINHLHRHQECPYTANLLQQIFACPKHFHHHPPLPETLMTRDEGAANHTRLCTSHGDQGLHLFVYNQQMQPGNNAVPIPKRYPARQTREASEAIARAHQLSTKQIIVAQQHPDTVDQGVFHNDVIAVGNESLFLVHEDAFVDQGNVINAIQQQSQRSIQIIEIKRRDLSVTEAVQSYLFNSQLITLPDSTMALIAPMECEQIPAVHAVIQTLQADDNNPISQVHYLDLKQSMQNGGGPACLRLRVVLNETQLAAMHQPVIVNDKILDTLELWVNKHYRTELHANDLDDPALIQECHLAFDELFRFLNLTNPSMNCF